MSAQDLLSLLGEPSKQTPYGVIPEQPDINTQEIATYGDTYLDVKSVLYIIDMMKEAAQRSYERAIASCHGKEYETVKRMLTRSPYVVSQEKPHVESLEELNAARKARSIYRAASTLRTIEKWRVEVEMYGAMHGAYQYGQAMMEQGVSTELMKRVFKRRASKGLTNSYESIRDTREGRLNDGLTEQERSLARMAEMILMANEYDRMEREYPEDDSGDRLMAAWQEQVETARRRANPASDDGPDHPVDGSEPDSGDRSEEFEMDMSVVDETPRHVGLDFVTEDIEDEDDDVPDGPDGGYEDTEVHVDEDDAEPREGIGPVASTPEEALEAVPRAERLRLGPGTPDEVRFFLDSKHGGIERLGPVSSSVLDAVDTLDDVLVTFMPPSHPDDFAKWYGRHIGSEHPSFGDVQGYDDGDEGIVLVMSHPEDSEDGDDDGKEHRVAKDTIKEVF